MLDFFTACSSQQEDRNLYPAGFSDSIKSSNLAEELYKLAMLHYSASDIRHALILMDSAYRVAVKTGEDLTGANSLNMLGSFYIETGDTTKAIALLKESYRISVSRGYYKQTGVALTNLALTEAGKPGYTDTLRQALKWFGKTGKKCSEAGMVYNNLGNHSANPDTAIFYLQKAAETGEMANDHEVTVLAYNNMAYSYLDKKDRGKATWCLIEKAIPLALKYNDDKMLANLYDTYADVLLEGGDGVNAAQYLKKSLEASQKAAAKEAASQTRLLLALLDVRNKEITIREHETRFITQKRHIQRLWILAIVLILMTISGLLTANIFRLREKVRSREKEKEHTRRLLELETSEKRRVAMQLHDMIGPVKNILLKQIGEVETADPAIGANIRIQLTTLADRLRSLSHRMNNAMLDQLTLAEVVETLKHDFSGISGSEIVFQTDPVCRNIRGEITGHLFFILLELLSNAMKYAPGCTIEITISAEFENLYLIYRDDGPGFHYDAGKDTGMGLPNICSRAAILNGKAYPETSPGQGTIWTITIPFKFAEDSSENS